MPHYTASTRSGSSERPDGISTRYIHHVNQTAQDARDSLSLPVSRCSFIPVSTIVTTGRPSKRRQLLRHLLGRHSNESNVATFAALPSVDPSLGRAKSMGEISMAPSPHTRPLLSSPVARDETIQGHLQVAIAKGSAPKRGSSQFAAARRNAEVIRSADTEPLPIRSSTGSYEAQRRLVTARDIYTTVLREREKCATFAAAESRYVREWGFFLKCYAEGRYNLSTPPEPPPRRAEFTYLPAPAPPTEAERVKTVEFTDVAVFPKWAAEKQKKYVLLARKTFDIPFASISYVNRTHETLRCEIGYRPDYILGFIPRGYSLAAHAILSTEPMVILDTSTDWRTQGNSLVQRHPGIRFYAAAPLITKTGHHVGAFAIFDKRPRTEFGIIARRQLVEFAKRVILDLEVAAIQYHDSQATVFGQRMDLIEHCRTRSLTTGDRKDAGYPAPEIPTRSPSRLFVRDRKLDPRDRGRLSNERLIITEDTLPDSGSDYETDPVLKPDKEISGSGSKLANSRHQSSASSQHATKSTVISGPSTPPQSPSTHFSISTEGFHGTTRDLEKPPNTPVAVPRRASTASGASNRTILPVHDDLLPAPLRSGSSSTLSNRRLDHLPHTPGPRHSAAEASFAAALVAGSLGYDFLYLLRFSPIDRAATEDGSMVVEKFNTEVLVSHGMPTPEPYFDPTLHLRALRAARGLIYQNPTPETAGSAVEYEFGVLLPVVRSNAGSTTPRKAASVTEIQNVPDTDAKSLQWPLRNSDPDLSSKMKGKGKETKDGVRANNSVRRNTETCRGGIILAGFMRKAPIDGEVSSDNIAEMSKLGRRLKELLLLG